MATSDLKTSVKNLGAAGMKLGKATVKLGGAALGAGSAKLSAALRGNKNAAGPHKKGGSMISGIGGVESSSGISQKADLRSGLAKGLDKISSKVSSGMTKAKQGGSMISGIGGVKSSSGISQKADLRSGLAKGLDKVIDKASSIGSAIKSKASNFSKAGVKQRGAELKAKVGNKVKVAKATLKDAANYATDKSSEVKAGGASNLKAAKTMDSTFKSNMAARDAAIARNAPKK